MARLPLILRWGPYDTPGGWLRGAVIMAAAAAFLAAGGAFGSDSAALPARYAYWFGLMFLGWIWGVAISRFFFRAQWARSTVWPRVVVSSLVIAIPFSVVVALVGHYGLGAHYVARDIPELVGSVTAITLVMVTINVLVDRSMEGVTQASAEPARFLERLPLKLRGAEIWAVEAEDHYLRLHTSKGQDLILMRLSDAIVELEGIEGAQAHRSWWVAREAITSAERGDGRATLTLKDGAQVPVSRTYARLLRERGWI
ncbi:MAG: LytTR family DNA-binding domain-containing protein [Caulobacteraceae bacterium]